mgnify:CR=1 FL=1
MRTELTYSWSFLVKIVARHAPSVSDLPAKTSIVEICSAFVRKPAA